MTTSRTFTENEQQNRDAWTTSRVENDCDGCETLYYADSEAWRPAERCPVHGIDYAEWWAELNRELDRRWPDTWNRRLSHQDT